VEKQTGWTSEQLEHRVKRYKKLGSAPIKQDLEAVATKLLALKWNSLEQQWNVPGPAPHRDFIRIGASKREITPLLFTLYGSAFPRRR
jgi:hypothetical protein